MTIKIHGFYSAASNKSGNCWIQNYLRANSNGKYLPGDAEYLRNCNAGIFPKKYMSEHLRSNVTCRNISEVPMPEYLRNYSVCRNISEVDNAG